MRILQKARFALVSIAKTFLFSLKAIYSNELSKEKRTDLAVSLTTYGWRFNFVFITVETLLSQSVKPAAVYLWIFEGDKCSLITNWILMKQEKRGLVIKRVKQDVKSYKKLSFMLDESNAKYTHVVTADDDVLYPKNWMKNFVEHPKFLSHVLCNRARVISYDNFSNDLLPYKKWPLAKVSDNKEHAILPTGVSGICYPLRSLDKRISDFEAISNLCPFADDIWYKLTTFANGYDSYLIQDKVNHYPLVITSLTKGLEKLNVLADLNDKQFLQSVNFFGLQKIIFKKSMCK